MLLLEIIKFYGFDILKYYYIYILNICANFPWQIKIAYSIIILSLLFLILLLIYFIWKYYKKQKYIKKQQDIIKKFQDRIENLLIDENIDNTYLINKLADIINEEDIESKYFIQVLINIRLKYPNKLYFKNMQIIANELGIKDYIEHNLLVQKNIFRTLQCLVMLQIEIAEGRLSNYTNSKNKNIRTFARIAYMYCSNTEPYKFLFYELENNYSILNNMLIHYTLGWMNLQDKILPNFIYYAKTLKNDKSSAFILNEMKYFYNNMTIADLIYFYNSSKRYTKNSAIQLSDIFKYDDIKNILLPKYNEQAEDTKIEIIKILRLLGKEKSVEILIELYKNSISKIVKECILLELMYLDKHGINAFKQLELKSTKDILIFNNIESAIALEQLKNLSKDSI